MYILSTMLIYHMKKLLIYWRNVNSVVCVNYVLRISHGKTGTKADLHRHLVCGVYATDRS